MAGWIVEFPLSPDSTGGGIMTSKIEKEIKELSEFIDSKAMNGEFWNTFLPPNEDTSLYNIEFSGLGLTLEPEKIVMLLRALKDAIKDGGE